MIANILVWYAVFDRVDKKLIVAFLNVDQGDSIFIETPDGIQVLIDAGRDRKALRELSKLMPFFDRSLDIVIATHPDEDHIGGLPDVLERFKTDVFIEPGVEKNSGTYNTITEILEEKDIETLVIDRKTTVHLDSDVSLKILFPVTDASGFESNAASLIMQLVYKEHEFLLTGDAPKRIEKYLVLEYGETLQSDVLKIGHHGSKTSSDPSFVAAVAPVVSVISAGENNRYGHPHEEVVSIFENQDTRLLSTADGTIVFTSDGTILSFYIYP